MRTKVISLSIALLIGMSAWADDVWNCNVYEDCSKNVQTIDIPITGQENGYMWVELGLPSGVKWASCNVGATTPEDFGNYYAWGEVLPKEEYTSDTYKYANGYKYTKYCIDASYGDEGFTDGKTTLELENDAAHVNRGGSWRMPTVAEWSELIDNCIWTWTTQNGVKGYVVTSKANNNSIFLPAAGGRYDTYCYGDSVNGYYWFSSLNISETGHAWRLNFNSDNVSKDDTYRHDGLPVRPVCQSVSGRCGNDLYWQYAGHTLTISGTGAMYDYNGSNMPWLLFRDTTDAVVLESGITHIGNNAFNGFVKLGKIELPSTLTSIGANAFAGCRKLYDIYAYPIEPPVADNSSFANYNVNLYVPCDNLRDYQMDAVFGSFKYIQCMSTTGTEEVQTDITTDHAAQKVFRDGQVYILREGVLYTLTGIEVK